MVTATSTTVRLEFPSERSSGPNRLGDGIRRLKQVQLLARVNQRPATINNDYSLNWPAKPSRVRMPKIKFSKYVYVLKEECCIFIIF